MAKSGGILDQVVDGKKVCPRCAEVKVVAEFHKRSSRHNGLQLWCKSCGLANKKHRYPERASRVRTIARNARFVKAYGMTLDEVSEAANRQDGKCAICGEIPIRGGNQYRKGGLVVDHDHKTGKFRGMICHECNFGLGKFGDSIDRLLNAIKYLEDNK